MHVHAYMMQAQTLKLGFVLLYIVPPTELALDGGGGRGAVRQWAVRTYCHNIFSQVDGLEC